MRPTIVAVTILILAVAIGVGWKDHLRLVQTRSKHERLTAQASGRGVIFDSNSAMRVTKRQREEYETRTKPTLAKFISFGMALQAQNSNRGPADLEFQKQSAEFLASMETLSAHEFRMLLSELSGTRDITDDTRGRLIGGGLRSLAHADPQTALTILTESSDLINSPGLVENLISDTLGSLAKNSPETALEWLRKNAGKFPEVVNEGVKNSLIAGIAVQDLKLSLQLIGEFGIADPTQTIRGIASAATSPEERTVTLGALREYFATVPDQEARTELGIQAARSLAREARSDGFETASRWIADAGFTDVELNAIAGDLYDVEKNKTGRWIEWIGKTLPADTARDRICYLVAAWTDNNPKAAGEWLFSAADSPAKHTAALAYAEKVFPVDRDAAIRWALSVPASEEQNTTLKRLHIAWPKDDPEGAAAFEKEHGIK